MANFLSGCACHGARPNSVEIKDTHIREHLIAKLMQERKVLRSIIAPSGFGKSILAAQYADIVFSFKKVFWIDCQSPCFIRDLDSNEIAEYIIQICENPNLVVFDNVGVLDESRAELFSNVIDELLEYDCEVITTARPYKDSFMKTQTDSLVIHSDELLVDDDELRDEVLNNIERIPIAQWGNVDPSISLIKSALKEDFTDSTIFSLFLVYLLQESSIDILDKYISKSQKKLFIELNKEYIYFGINENKSSFSVPSIFTSKLLSLFRSHMHIIIDAMSCTDRSDLSEKLCSLLEEEGKFSKAVEIAGAIGNKNLRKTILTKYNEDSIRNMYLTSTCDLYNKQYSHNNDSDINLAYQSLRLAILGRVDEAIRYAYKVLDNSSSSIDNKLMASLIFMRFGSSEEKFQTLKIIRNLSNEFKIDTFLNNTKLSSEEKFKCEAINRLIDIYFAIFSDSLDPFEKWCANLKDEITDIDIICAEAIFSCSSFQKEEVFQGDSFYNFVSTISRFYNSADARKYNFYTFALISAYFKVEKEIEFPVKWNINAEIKNRYKAYKNIYHQQKAQISGKHKSFKRNTNYNIEDNISDEHISFASNYEIPKLRINVFGGLSAFIGDDEIISSSFGRQNIKLICCILALENGNEIGKDELSKIIWPGSGEASQRVNINSHWSVIRKLFTLPNGECPYLIRNQNSYKFVKRYLTTDLQLLEDVCTKLTLGPIDSSSWSDLININENIISGALLPSEHTNVYIINKRNEYKNKVVDALLAASNRLIDAGEIQQSLWFAHKAYSRDAKREDVFVTLMKAQMKAGQRTPAIETYFACKKFLEEDLGIDPSQKIYRMYKQVISDNLSNINVI